MFLLGYVIPPGCPGTWPALGTGMGMLLPGSSSSCRTESRLGWIEAGRKAALPTAKGCAGAEGVQQLSPALLRVLWAHRPSSPLLLLLQGGLRTAAPRGELSRPRRQEPGDPLRGVSVAAQGGRRFWGTPWPGDPIASVLPGCLQQAAPAQAVLPVGLSLASPRGKHLSHARVPLGISPGGGFTKETPQKSVIESRGQGWGGGV